jgi:DDE superfamily endonuclease
VAENTVRRTLQRVENTLVKSGAFALPGGRKRAGAEPPWQVIAVDVTESPRERPKKQRACYSGKKKRPTLKSQGALDKATGTILAAACGPGREHDFRLFPRSKLRPPPSTELLADSGYPGLTKRHPNSRTPHKRRRKTIALPPEQQAHHRAWASERVLVEKVIRRLKAFRVLKETYRHRRKRFSLRVHLLAGLYNHDLKLDFTHLCGIAEGLL